MKRIRRIFYVYEHWRPDKDVCFYVGKGHEDRAQSMRRRNRYHKNIVGKLLKLGMCVEVRLVRSGLTEREAFILEASRIAFWRDCGVKLVNLTNGGEGTCGFTHSQAVKELLSDISQKWFQENPEFLVYKSELAKKQWEDPEFRDKIIESRNNLNTRNKMKKSAKKRCTEEWRARKAEQARKQFQDPLFLEQSLAKLHSAEAQEKQKASNRRPENRKRAAERARAWHAAKRAGGTPYAKHKKHKGTKHSKRRSLVVV